MKKFTTLMTALALTGCTSINEAKIENIKIKKNGAHQASISFQSDQDLFGKKNPENSFSNGLILCPIEKSSNINLLTEYEVFISGTINEIGKVNDRWSYRSFSIMDMNNTKKKEIRKNKSDYRIELISKIKSNEVVNCRIIMTKTYGQQKKSQPFSIKSNEIIEAFSLSN